MGRFDDVYIPVIGESHVAILGDYILHYCDGMDISGLVAGRKHGSIEHKKIHYKGWAYFQELYDGVMEHFAGWLNNRSSVAVWIRLGSWDFSHKGLEHTMSKEISYFQQALKWMKSVSLASTTVVDLRVISTPPMPKWWNWNRHALSGFTYKMKNISENCGVDYVDTFQIIKPCNNQVSRLSPNHYWHRKDTFFDGNVGETAYLGVFLPHVCTGI